MKIICDTNIWYDIGNGVIPYSEISDLYLVATDLSITELMTTQKLLSDHKIVIRAIDAMLNLSAEIYKLNPIDYILLTGNEQYNPIFSKTDAKIGCLKNLLNVTNQEINSLITQTNFRNSVNYFDNPLALISAFFNEQLVSITWLSLTFLKIKHLDPILF